MATSTTDAAAGGRPNKEDDAALLARLVAKALNESVTELRKDNDTRMTQITATFREELSTFRESEEKRLAQFEKAIANWKPTNIKTHPITDFWTVYKKVADEYDNDLIDKYVGDLDNSLIFAGLFSAVTSAFIVQIIPAIQPDPADLTNVLLLRILQQNTSFGGADPLAPVSNVPIGVVRAQSILFASLAVTLFVAFVTVLGKQWILYYTQGTTWGNIVDRGKERQEKLVGLQKWGLHPVMESLPVMLQFALLLFGIALVVYLWDFDISAAEVVLAVTSFGFIFYVCITIIATTWRDFPFQTPLSILLPKVLPWAKEFSTHSRVWLKQLLRRKVTALPHRIERLTEHAHLTHSLGRAPKTFAGETTPPNPAEEDTVANDHSMTLSNPSFWRVDPLFTPPIPNGDIAASAGFWLLENSTDFSAATAVAAVSSEFQWPSHHPSSTALIRLHDTYMECFQAREFDKSIRLRALQSAAAYYVLYRTQLIWSTWKSFEVKVEKPPLGLLPDLFLHQPNNEWGGDDVFEYLLHIRVEDRSELVNSARFLSYIAPYWFCGYDYATIRFRPSRLQTLNELIEVLEKSQALNPATVTNCILSVGAAMDFPLHPEDLIRVDKSGYIKLTFKSVVEHIHGIVLAKGYRSHHAKTTLEIIHTLVKKAPFLPVDAVWINKLLKSAARGKMDDETFTALLRLSGLREVDDTAASLRILSAQDNDHIEQGEPNPQPPGGTVKAETPTPEYALLDLILRNVKACGAQKDGWKDDAVYGGLIAIGDIPGLRFCLPKAEFLETLSKAMEKETEGENEGENEEGDKLLRVREAACCVILAARDGWLRSTELRPVLEEFDIPRKLHSVVIETGRSEHQHSFLEMMEILSKDRFWHPYLRKAMDIWLPLHREGPTHALHILTKVGKLLLPRHDDYNVEKSLEKVLEEEWKAVPGRPPMELTVDMLKPLAEVTEGFTELYFTENDRKAVLAVVEQVIPRLENWRDDSYGGPDNDIRHIIDSLLRILRQPIQSSRRRPTYR